MQVRAPGSAKDDYQRSLFEGAMRLRYSILLEKARAMMTHTLAMARRTGERSSWVERAAEAERHLALAKEREEAALGRLPYTRAQLQEALDHLARAKAAQAASKP
jgi:hypothetical protein